MSTTRDVTRSWQLHQRALELIPLATCTHSKAPRDKLQGIEPCFIERGSGCRLWDVDGNEYLDLRCALGPITLGYGYPPVVEAVREQLEKGTVFSYPSPLEAEVAERLVELIPCAESVRFLRTGGEAMSATMKLARAFTGRDRILKCGYHGWLTTMAGPGVPEAVRSVHTELPWGDAGRFEAELQRDADHIAAITVAYSYTAGDQAGGFLTALRDLADRYGCLLVFDEIVTGFRLANGGASERFRVTPDLAVVSKGMANGFPVAAYLGRRDVMETVRQAVISSTFGGECTGLAAAKACCDIYLSEDVVGHLEARGRQLVDGLNGLFTRHGAPARVSGVAPCPILQWGAPPEGATAQLPPSANISELSLRFEAEWLKRGVITYQVMYPNYSHTAADIDEILSRADDGLAAMAREGCFR